MRSLALALAALAALAAVSCGAAGSTATAPPPPDAELFRVDGGFTFPIGNGARIPVENGWIEPRFDTLAPSKSVDLDVVVGSEAGRDASEVLVSYDMIEMAHGARTVSATAAGGGHHRAQIAMGMYGTWRIVIQITLGGVTSVSTLVLAGTGL